MSRSIHLRREDILAIHYGHKTQLRCPVPNRTGHREFRFKDGKWQIFDGDIYINVKRSHRFGGVGDILCVKEAYTETPDGIIYMADDPDLTGVKWHPAPNMSNDKARLKLRVEKVIMEKLQDISVTDIMSEGCPDASDPYSWFFKKWNHQYAEKGYPWDSNPLVWVLFFSIFEHKKELFNIY